MNPEGLNLPAYESGGPQREGRLLALTLILTLTRTRTLTNPKGRALKNGCSPPCVTAPYVAVLYV